MKELKHLGLRIEGVTRKGEQKRILLARNTTTGRAWLLNTDSGIGEPIPERPAEPQPRPKVAPRPGGPHRCDWCGERKLFVIRFSPTEYVTKCLSCRRFVVDGHEERPARIPRAARGAEPRQQSLCFTSVKPPAKASGAG